MATKSTKPKNENRFLRAIKAGRPKTPEERIQELVDAGLMKQEEADEAKKRHREK